MYKEEFYKWSHYDQILRRKAYNKIKDSLGIEEFYIIQILSKSGGICCIKYQVKGEDLPSFTNLTVEELLQGRIK